MQRPPAAHQQQPRPQQPHRQQQPPQRPRPRQPGSTSSSWVGVMTMMTRTGRQVVSGAGGLHSGRQRCAGSRDSEAQEDRSALPASQHAGRQVAGPSASPGPCVRLAACTLAAGGQEGAAAQQGPEAARCQGSQAGAPVQVPCPSHTPPPSRSPSTHHRNLITQGDLMSVAVSPPPPPPHPTPPPGGARRPHCR